MEGRTENKRKQEMGLCRRITMFFVGLLECCIFGGLVFGWPQLVLILKEEGIYNNLCTQEHNPVPQITNITISSENILKKSLVDEMNSNIISDFPLATILKSAAHEVSADVSNAPQQRRSETQAAPTAKLLDNTSLIVQDTNEGRRLLPDSEALSARGRKQECGEDASCTNSNTVTSDGAYNLTEERVSQGERWNKWKEEKCSSSSSNESHPQSNGSVIKSDHKDLTTSCTAQDEMFALIYTISVVCYGLPSILVGYLLHYAGLWVTRITAGIMLVMSFVFLAFASVDQPQYLFPAMILLGMGGNQLRLCAVQLGDLFPERRTTAITVLTGSYSVSSSLFFFFQVAADAGVQRSVMCWVMVSVATASLFATFLMPVRHVAQCNQISRGSSRTRRRGSNTPPREDLPLGSSLCSTSSILHQYWLFAALFSLNSYQQTFNYWVTVSSCTASEIRSYTALFSFCGLVGAMVAPVLGHVTDSIISRAKRRTTCAFSLRVEEVCANFLPLLLTSVCSIMMYACLLVYSGWAIYASLICLIVCRSCIFSTSTAFLRTRFPVEHLDRLLGIYGTVVSILLLLQYPHFKWIMNQYYSAVACALAIIALNLSYPLHLLHRSGIKSALLKLPQPPEGEDGKLLRRLSSGLTRNTGHE